MDRSKKIRGVLDTLLDLINEFPEKEDKLIITEARNELKKVEK